MIQILIYNDKTYTIKVNEYISVLNLKEKIYQLSNINIHDQILYHNGKILSDNMTLKESNIINNSIIHLNKKILGGFDTFSILMWIIYVVLLLIYLLLLISGILPVIAHGYEYILEWSLKKLGSLFGIANNKAYVIFIWILTFILRILIIYYFVYAITTFIIFPIIYSKKDKLCSSFQLSNKFGWIVALVFIIIYAIFNIPDELLSMLRYLGKLTPYVNVIVSPLSGVLQEFADVGKYAGIYAIPFVGTPFLEGYHTAISFATSLLKQGVDFISQYNCDDDDQRRKLGRFIKSAPNNPELKDWIKSYNAGVLVEILPIALIPELYNRYKCKVDNLPFWEKINPFNKEASEFYTAKYASQGFCFALNIIRGLSGMLDSIGGSEQIANMIKSGNMAGVGAFIAFIICFILVLLNVF